MSPTQDEAGPAAGSAPRFQHLTEATVVQVWTADAAGAFTSCNPECARYLGFPAGDPCPRNGWIDFVHPNEAAPVRDAWLESVKTGLVFEMEFRLRGGDGRHRWFLGRAQSIRPPAGVADRWVATLTDIDGLKRRLEAARQESEARGAFLAKLAHELRMPLTPVVMITAALMEDPRLPADIREQLALAQGHLGVASRVITGSFDLRHDGSGGPPPKKECAVENSAPDRRPRRILLVEDHAPTLQVMGRLLQRDGHEVTATTTLAGALLAAEAREFDLLISDLGLPDGSGNDLMKHLQAARGLAGIALTGYGMDYDIVASRQAGFAAHLTKPVELSTLRRLIASTPPMGPAEPSPGAAP